MFHMSIDIILGLLRNVNKNQIHLQKLLQYLLNYRELNIPNEF